MIDEIPGAYKDIDEVLANQRDLTETLHTLKQMVCVKGSGQRSAGEGLRSHARLGLLPDVSRAWRASRRTESCSVIRKSRQLTHLRRRFLADRLTLRNERRDFPEWHLGHGH